MEYLFEEVSLLDPRQKVPVRSTWDGLERLVGLISIRNWISITDAITEANIRVSSRKNPWQPYGKLSRKFQSSDLIQKIRDYQDTHTELKKSHHFVFDCPLDKAHAGKPDFVWLGLNPGSDETDWQKWPSGPNMEETLSS